METVKSIRSEPNAKIDSYVKFLFSTVMLTAMLILAVGLISCSDSGVESEPKPIQTGEIKGTVKDKMGNPYPNTKVIFSKGAEITDVFSNSEGKFEGETKSIGTYKVTLALPLTTVVNTNIPISVDVVANKASTVDFVVEPTPVEAHLNFGNVQLLEEIVDKDGNTPTDPNEPLYAKNIFDAPLGLLTAIKAPDGHPVTLSEFKTAKGNMLVHCNGDSSTIEINLEGMIPNGTYTFWLAYLNKKVKVGESIDFANDFVNFTNPPIGPTNGSGNVVIAGADGSISTSLQHTSCILTDEVALVIPILYHLNGNTFGGSHVPDSEETVHMLVYFQ